MPNILRLAVRAFKSWISLRAERPIDTALARAQAVDSVGFRLYRRKSLGQGSRRVPLKTARRGCREREIELHPDLVALLKRRKADAFEHGLAGAGDYVFCTRDGRPLSQRNVARDLSTAADRAGLNPEGVEPLSTHDLRHTAISRWIAAGLDPVTVARMAGDTLETILKTYAHEFDKAKNREANRAKLTQGTAIRL